MLCVKLWERDISCELDLLNEVKRLLLAWDRSLSGRIAIGQNLEEFTMRDRWVRLSLDPSRVNETSIATHDRIMSMRIIYYHKSADKQSYDYSSELKDTIFSKLPKSNRPYWRYWETEFDSNETDAEPLQYEGFSLVLDFWKMQTHVCLASEDTVLLLETGAELTTEAGVTLTF